ncbi:MAG: elongation factor G [Clostridia bacterium]|nr:elongation factor G [Clostridia bacterium]
MAISSKQIKNVAIIGANQEGKTSVCEAMLYTAGVIDRLGTTQNGNSFMDFDDIEKAKGYSINTAVAYINWNDVKINIIDLPGSPDFEGELVEGITAADSAVLVMDASGDTSIGADTAIELCLGLNKPVIIFITGMDKANANYVGTVNALSAKYTGKIAPVQIPIIESEKMTGFVNVIQDTAYKFSKGGPEEIAIPASLADEVEEMRTSLIETAAENDEELLEKYFEEGTLEKDEIVLGVRTGISACSVMPVLAGSGLQNWGIGNLLNEIAQYMPSASERNGVPAKDLASGKDIAVDCEENGPFVAQVWKTEYDNFSGKLNYLRVYRGKLTSGMSVLNTKTGQTEKVNQIFLLRGKKTELVTELGAGDIGAVNKLTDTDTNETLCDASTNIEIAPIVFPVPTYSRAIYCKTKGADDKMMKGLDKIHTEDYTFIIERPETGEVILTGLGASHLDVITQKLKAINNNNLDVELTEPKIPYRETIRGTSTADGKHKKQSGGHGQYGHCKVRFEPFDGKFEFGDEVVGGAVPKQYIPAVEKGLIECMAKGVLAGYPMTGVRAVLFDGSYHPVDSSEMAFKMAASLAYKDGIAHASPVLMQPIKKLTIKAPQSYLGDIMGDMSQRGGRILDTTTEGKLSVITADVPLASISNYTMDLRGITKGQGRFTIEDDGYEDINDPMLTKKIIEAAKAEQAE